MFASKLKAGHCKCLKSTLRLINASIGGAMCIYTNTEIWPQNPNWDHYRFSLVCRVEIMSQIRQLSRTDGMNLIQKLNRRFQFFKHQVIIQTDIENNPDSTAEITGNLHKASSRPHQNMQVRPNLAVHQYEKCEKNPHAFVIGSTKAACNLHYFRRTSYELWD